MKFVWTKQALRDLAAIHGFIAMDSPFYASLVINTILEVEPGVCAQPLAGSMIKERPRRDVRQIKRYSYRIIYRVRARQIDVLTVVHTKRDFKLEGSLED